MAFQRATKKQAKAKIALTGPSGSGKTLSAMRLAKGFGGKWAYVDTENRSASLYAGHQILDGWEFDIDEISPPYTTQKYLMAIEAAVKGGYDGLIIDSLTHAWAGEGGLLSQKEGLDSRGGNQWTNWASITKMHERLKAWILHAPIHMICTMRSKQDYVLEQNDKGKAAPKKVGLAPIQRDGLEYEFTVVFDIGMDHQYMVSKDRTSMFDGMIDILTEKTGETISAWLADGEVVISPPTSEKPKPSPKSTHDEQKEFHPGDYVLGFGKVHKGKKLRDIPNKDLAATIAWAEGQKNPHSIVREFLAYAIDYMVILDHEKKSAEQIDEMKAIANDETVPC